jgi:hypothetical protein
VTATQRSRPRLPDSSQPSAGEQARPHLPADSEPAPAELARTPLPADAPEASPSSRVQERGTEMAPAPESAAPLAASIPAEPKSIPEQKTLESDPTSAPTTPPSNRILHLEGKGSIIVLGRRAGAALELAQHPDRLRKLIRRGALFTVQRGTPIKLVPGNRSGNISVVRVRLMAGSMVGREGWAQKSQIAP